MDTKVIKIDWTSEKSISLAERAKSRLENAGWSLVHTYSGGPWTNESTLIYERGQI